MWQPVARAVLVAGLIAAPVGVDLQHGLWGGASQAYARGSSAGGPGGGGPGEGRGGGVSGRGGAEHGAASAAGNRDRGGAAENAASAAGPDVGGGGGGGNRESREFSDRGAFGAVGRAPDRKQDGAPAHITAKASAGPGQEFDTDTAVFVSGEPATGRGGGTTPQVRSDRALAHERDHEQDLAVARERYNRAVGAAAHITAKASAGPGQEFDTDEAVFVFGEPATKALIQAGWAMPKVRSGRVLPEHGQKVATYVAIATALGYPAYVGVMQAIFGSDGRGRRPAGDWWDVNLDLNGDGIVDEQDLELAQQQNASR
jgi:hypothetical protein